MTEQQATASDPDDGFPIGYLPAWSYRAGDRVDVHVWSTASWRADLVRLRHGDPRPNGPGLKETPIGVESGIRGPSACPTVPGSMAWAPVKGLPRSLVLTAWARPTRRRTDADQAVVTGLRHDDGMAWGLGIGADGHWQIQAGDSTSKAATTAAVGEWSLVSLSVDARRGVIRVTIHGPGDWEPAAAELAVPSGALGARLADVRWIGLGGALAPGRRPDGAGARATFDGVIASPCVLSRDIGAEQLERIRRGEAIASAAGDALLAGWSFPAGREPVTVGGAAGGDVVLRNTPAAAVAGPHGVADAIRCHSDAMTDAEWPIGAALPLPSSLASGVYAVRLSSEAGVDRVPFVVRPDPDRRASVLLLLPTMTYQAYANERLPEPESYLAGMLDAVRPGPLDRWLARHPEYGMSVYDCHADGCGVFYASLRRPIPNTRPDYVHWASGEPRHLGADLFIVDWLEHVGIAYDVACDDDLDRDGLALLEPYDVVVTGSHPEYCTAAMLDALEGYLDSDGRLMYLGGNGFYWVTSTSPRQPGVVEVRRGRHGFPWQAADGETRHAFCGTDAGLWAERGRPPRDLVGLSCVAMGPEDPAPGYQIAPDIPASDRWILDGVKPTTTIGDRGRLMGGAAGHEIDCVDREHGHLAGITVLASSHGHTDTLVKVADVHGLPGPDSMPHADLVLYRRPGGGIVFSTGSICWAGSLGSVGGDPVVQRVTENAVRHFSRPRH